MEAKDGVLTLTVNGEQREVQDDGRRVLINVLRSDLGLCGVRAGCAIGECGACTVLVDGSPVRSCVMPVADVAGTRVTTPEGLGAPGSPHPVQRAFIEGQAAQCGYCVNGIIMTVAGIADSATSTTDLDAALDEALDEHLCRCGAHVRMLEAARSALGLSQGPVSGAPLGTTQAHPPDGRGAEGPIAPPQELPAAIATHPRIEQWIRLDQDGTFRVYAGKVELGQGIRTAFCQIVAAQLGVPVESLRLAAVRTGESPDQRFTAGSLSIEDGGTALAFAARALRRVLLGRAATTLGVAADRLVTTADGVEPMGGGPGTTFVEMAALGPVTGVIEPTDLPRWELPPLGRPLQRTDLLTKLTGAAAYLHDMTLPGMLHARVILPPGYGAQLESSPLDGARALPGVVDVVVDGRLVLVLAEREEQAVRAAERLRQDLVWRPVPGDAPADLEAHLRSLPREPLRVRQDPRVHEALDSGRSLQATYSTPYQSHGSMAPSVAVALAGDDGRLHVWTHAQGIYPLRRELSTLLDLPEEQLTVEHVDGPGCYGMNGADDTAALAAIAARAVPGRPVRLQYTVHDEFGWEPYGSAMVVDLQAGIDDRGCLQAWRHRGITDTHMVRPGGTGDRLIASWLRADGVPRPWPGASEGGGRNGVPLYDVPLLDVVADHVRGPLRTASLRCLGSYANIFAIESFMDELAELAGEDPVRFRLAHISDERARAVLRAVAERAGWRQHVGPSGRGMGVAVAHYKDSKAYTAQVAEVDVDPERGEFRVVRILVVADAGAVVNPDGLRNQLEGGTLQGLSRALFEEMTPGADGAMERDWTSYRVLRFRDVPQVDVHVLDRPGLPPLGVGESATPPVPAAVANAIDDAIGIRLRRLPLTAAQMQRRLLEMDDREAQRVLL